MGDFPHMNETNVDIPIVKAFIHNGNYYVYDTGKNQILSVTRDHYIEIIHLLNVGLTNYQLLDKKTKNYYDILMLINKGYFKPAFAQTIIHPESQCLSSVLDRGINDLTLQVTKDCNFNCRYCLYAARSQIERTHEQINMSWNIAKKSLDYLIAHSKDVDKITVAFYGGEPLLNFEVIKSSINYMNEKVNTKSVVYNMTINGSILNDNILEYLVSKNVHLTISLDGPEELQNRHRKFSKNGKPTFRVVIDNVLNIQRKHPDFFERNVKFISVGFGDEKYEEVADFFSKIGVSENTVLYLPAGMEGIDYIQSNIIDINTSDLVGKHRANTLDAKVLTILEQIYMDKSQLPLQWHHNGPCIPGFKRLFVDVNGTFYLCEKVLERKEFSIGDIYTGIDEKLAYQLLNIGKLTESRCMVCWASRFCNICAAYCNDIETDMITSKQKLLECDRQEAKTLLFFKQHIDKMSV